MDDALQQFMQMSDSHHKSTQAAEQFDREPQQQWQQQPFISERRATLDDRLQQFIQMSKSHRNNTQAACRRMEAHCRFIIQKQNDLGSDMKANPREECTTVVTERGKVLDERKIERKEEESLSEKEKDVEKEEEESEIKEIEEESE
ncbi:hypothetical protein LR48_Vigan06g084800 [Vigna angularis]|uniref:Uncharacterized protein n=1 Tax=Phaseolus angularis TaxID=3914 RepID=A0A0L9USJ3_PHAAN|nr:hypothetical protein LR48_Vigan06g084800 [Vigna angularis]